MAPREREEGPVRLLTTTEFAALYRVNRRTVEIKRQMTAGQPGFLPANRPGLRLRLETIYEEIRALNTRGREVMPNVG